MSILCEIDKHLGLIWCVYVSSRSMMVSSRALQLTLSQLVDIRWLNIEQSFHYVVNMKTDYQYVYFLMFVQTIRDMYTIGIVSTFLLRELNNTDTVGLNNLIISSSLDWLASSVVLLPLFRGIIVTTKKSLELAIQPYHTNRIYRIYFVCTWD